MRRFIILPVLAALLLAGCTAAPIHTSKPAPTHTTNPNIAACDDFRDVFISLKKANDDRNSGALSVDAWMSKMNEAGTDYSGVALKSKGDVKERINDLVDLIDATPNGVRAFRISGPGMDAYLAKLQRVAQACTVAGVTMSFVTTNS